MVVEMVPRGTEFINWSLLVNFMYVSHVLEFVTQTSYR
jgi:hypothetical protein